MDKTSLIGVALGILAIGIGIVLKGISLSALLNPAAILIIIAGTMAAVVIAFPMKEIKRVPKLFKVLFTEQRMSTEKDLIPLFTQWASIARRDGLLALEDHADVLEDPFLKRGLKMVVDGQPQEYIRDMMEEDVSAMEDRHSVGAQIFSQAGTYAPTLGVLGAVVGLIAALAQMDDMDLLGYAISSAFIATLLGIFTGYVLWHPFANKLKRKSQEEARLKRIMIEGLLAVQEGVSARVVEEKMLTYLPASERNINPEDEFGEGINQNV